MPFDHGLGGRGRQEHGGGRRQGLWVDFNGNFKRRLVGWLWVKRVHTTSGAKPKRSLGRCVVFIDLARGFRIDKRAMGEIAVADGQLPIAAQSGQRDPGQKINVVVAAAAAAAPTVVAGQSERKHGTLDQCCRHRGDILFNRQLPIVTPTDPTDPTTPLSLSLSLRAIFFPAMHFKHRGKRGNGQPTTQRGEQRFSGQRVANPMNFGMNVRHGLVDFILQQKNISMDSRNHALVDAHADAIDDHHHHSHQPVLLLAQQVQLHLTTHDAFNAVLHVFLNA